MKKRILLLSLAIASLTGVRAQQDPQYTQFMFNKLTYNPAFAGSIENSICATLLYRTQWVGLGGNSDIRNVPSGTITPKGIAPQNYLGNIHAPIGQNFGVGLSILSDQLGFESSLSPMLSAAYKVRFKNGAVLAPGIGVGLMQKALDGTKLQPLDKNDNLIPTAPVSDMNLDLNAGLYYTMPSLSIFDRFYAGLSATHLNQGAIAYTWSGNTVSTQMKMHYYFITGAVYNLGTNFTIEPNILVKRDPAKFSSDINVYAMYQNRFRAGLTYRTVDAISLLLGYKFNPNMQIGYAYDFTTTKLIEFSSGSHEIMFQYCFWPKFKDKQPPPPIPRLTPRFL
jgi:type IX secretion system PorP/SprF family membrane protein